LPRFSLFPRETKFFVLLEQSAQNAVKTAKQLRDMVHIWENVKERVEVIADLEREGDAITHQIMSELHRTFFTPFDREDIAELASALDDLTDLVHAAADTMLLYDVKRPRDRARELCDVIAEAALEVEAAVGEIHGRIARDPLLRRCVEINRLENVGDSLYRTAVAELLAEGVDALEFVKWREVYEQMEQATDKCEDVANALEGVAIKYA